MTTSKKSETLVSIIINNYNYGRFLGKAIDSALKQTYAYTEIVVVDDGSTDNSRKVIASYGNQIIPVFKQNGGQGSAFNAGFKICNGDAICFLDSDDFFYPSKVEECLKLLTENTVNNPLVMVYHFLKVVDENGFSLNWQKPLAHVYNYSSPNLYEYAYNYRYLSFAASPTSGNMLSRELAERIFPIPEQGVRTSADNFVVRPALLLGEVYRMDQVLGKYRVHGENNWENTQNLKILSREFYYVLEIFLNSKLQENGKEPIISFFDFMHAETYYKKFGENLDLLKLALRVLKWRKDAKTIRFFGHTTKLTAKKYLKNLKEYLRLRNKKN